MDGKVVFVVFLLVTTILGAIVMLIIAATSGKRKGNGSAAAVIRAPLPTDSSAEPPDETEELTWPEASEDSPAVTLPPRARPSTSTSYGGTKRYGSSLRFSNGLQPAAAPTDTVSAGVAVVYEDTETVQRKICFLCECENSPAASVCDACGVRL